MNTDEIKYMFNDELEELATEIGIYYDETYEEAISRFREIGYETTAEIIEEMLKRRKKLEQVF